MTNYAKRIRDTREDRDYTQQSVAKVLHTTQSQYGKIELGKRKLSADEIITLCKLYDLSADYLLGFTDEPLPLPKPQKNKRP
jgi:transcriptional regulator with XRE-family HTH domain